jgi:hypothetical protein
MWPTFVLVVASLAGWVVNSETMAFSYIPASPCKKHMAQGVHLVGDSKMRELFDALCRDGGAESTCIWKKCSAAICKGWNMTFTRVDKADALAGLQNDTNVQTIVSVGLHDVLYTRNISVFEAGLEAFASRTLRGVVWLPSRSVDNGKIVAWKRQFLTNEAVAFYNSIAERVMRRHGIPVLHALAAQTIDGIHTLASAAPSLALSLCQQLGRVKAPTSIVAVMLWGVRYALVLSAGYSAGVSIGSSATDMTLHRSWLKMCLILLYVLFATMRSFSAKYASLDFFGGSLIALFAIAGIVEWSSFATTKMAEGVALDRDQTEEQKGWMQAMFLLYHLFSVAQVYIFVRVLVSGFIWLTSFGHAAFQKSGARISWIRFWSLMFRLNFFCVLLMVVTGNNYILYYVCALHTWWFLLVTGSLELGKFLGASENVVTTVLFLCCLLWDVPGAVLTLFSPLSWLLGASGSLHQFYFRTHLEHFIGGWGLTVGLGLVQVRARVSSAPSFLTGSCGLLCIVMWLVLVWCCENKFIYNAVHPYISVVPVHGLWLLRNCNPWLRARSLSVLVWIGRRSLELYLLQFHILMGANAKGLFVLVPYPLINFIVTGSLFVLCATTAYDCTKQIQEKLSVSSVKWIGVTVLLGLTVNFFAPPTHRMHVCSALLLLGGLSGLLARESFAEKLGVARQQVLDQLSAVRLG